jgi:hypothetical protein
MEYDLSQLLSRNLIVFFVHDRGWMVNFRHLLTPSFALASQLKDKVGRMYFARYSSQNYLLRIHLDFGWWKASVLSHNIAGQRYSAFIHLLILILKCKNVLRHVGFVGRKKALSSGVATVPRTSMHHVHGNMVSSLALRCSL